MVEANIFSNTFQLREIILNTRKPLIFKNFAHQWSCFEDGLKHWCETYDKCSKNKPYFERISVDADEPQFERKRQLIEMTAVDFLHEHGKEQTYWSGLNYKRKDELPEEATNGIDFGCFGFPKASDDCTFWLSSKSANTPCHYDSYGCNIVVQLFGRKSWLLFPPHAPLNTTRIPYEESSVYCLENFYAPNSEEVACTFSVLKEHCYHCVLEPNDVLIVPKHWWHYVEALEISLSVNAWIPLACDVENQIEECIVKHIIENMVQNYSKNMQEYIMNPNQLSTITSNEELLKVLQFLVKKKAATESGAGDNKSHSQIYQYQYLSETELKALINNTENIKEVSSMTEKKFDDYLKANSIRYKKCADSKNASNNSLDCIQESLLNSICSPQVIASIKREFFKRFKS